LFALGCGVDSKGLGHQSDAADAAKLFSDARPAEVRPADGREGAVPSPDAQTVDGLRTDAAVGGPDVSAEVAGGSLDLRASDATPTADGLLQGTDVHPSPDLLAKDLEADHAGSSGDDAPIVVPTDVLVVDSASPDGMPVDSASAELEPPDAPVPVDMFSVDGQAPDSAKPDLALDLPRDLAPDLGPDVSPDLRPDLGPDLALDMLPDVGPTPTKEWIIDNTSSIGGNAPTVLGAPTVTALDAGTALCFDGTQDGLQLSTNPVQGMAQFTIETLVYPELNSAGTPRVFYIADPATANPVNRMALQVVSTAAGNWHLLMSFSWNGILTNIEDTANTYPSGQWYWLALTYDGQTARIYVNGVLAKSAALTFGPMGTASIFLATRQNGQAGQFFPGCMRDIEFFDTALPAAQLRSP
jgi:hypothetical protein